MTGFPVYLFESGICLASLYGIYWLFLRKDTNFNVNRFFLLSAFLLSLTIPFARFTIRMHDNTVSDNVYIRLIGVKSYYTKLITMLDPEFWQRRQVMNKWEDGAYAGPGTKGYITSQATVKTSEKPKYDADIEKFHKVSLSVPLISLFIILVYFSGVIFYFLRFLFLFRHMIRFRIKYGITKQGKMKVIPVEEDISTFSFLGFVFINLRALPEDENANVLAHEQVHIRQHHTADLLLAHLACILQWYNPFAWLAKNALTVTHEYIADRAVINEGFELFDYQSLLLKQLISSRIFEPANNFNLKPIKKRIAMLTKSRTRKLASLKALLVSPIALILIMLFSDLSIRVPGRNDVRLKEVVAGALNLPELSGIWENTDTKTFGKMVLIEPDRFSVLEDYSRVKTYPLQITGNQMLLAKNLSLNYRLENHVLSIWWSDHNIGTYRKAPCENSMECYLAKQGFEIELPAITQTKTIENPDLIYRFFIANTEGSSGSYHIFHGGKKIDVSEIAGIIESERKSGISIDLPYLSCELFADKNVPMGEVDKVKNELRKNNALKIIFASLPVSKEMNPLLFHAQGLFFRLPPMDAKIISEEELIKQKIPVLRLNLDEKNLSPSTIHDRVLKFITGSDRGIVGIQYRNNTSYEECLVTKDIVMGVYNELRNKMSLEKYQVPFEDLGSRLQDNIRETYPIMLVEKNLDD